MESLKIKPLQMNLTLEMLKTPCLLSHALSKHIVILRTLTLHPDIPYGMRIWSGRLLTESALTADKWADQTTSRACEGLGC